MSASWEGRCDVFWTSHGCCLPRGHQPGTIHLCAVTDDEDVLHPDSQIVWWEGKGWMRSDFWPDDGGWGEVGPAEPFRSVPKPVRIAGLDNAVLLQQVSFDVPNPKPWWRRLFDRRKK